MRESPSFRPSARLPLTEVLREIYRPEADLTLWLDGVRRSAEEAFTGHAGAQTYIMRRSTGLGRVEAVSAEEPWRTAMAKVMMAASTEDLAPYFSGTSVRRAPTSHPALGGAREAGIGTIVVALGFADRERVGGLSFVFPGPTCRVARGTRSALDRISAHFGAALRLRGQPPRPEEARLSPDGAVLDARGDATAPAARERLRAAAVAIARARRDDHHEPGAGLALWTAMVEGRWTLVERFDGDGKRFWIARRNDSLGQPSPALGPRERMVLERAALGGSLRYVAYELGLPPSTVSDLLARGLRRLGLRSRAELVELYASLASRTDGDDPA